VVFSLDVVAIFLVFMHVGECLVEKCLELICISADFKVVHGYTIKLCSAKHIIVYLFSINITDCLTYICIIKSCYF